MGGTAEQFRAIARSGFFIGIETEISPEIFCDLESLPKPRCLKGLARSREIRYVDPAGAQGPGNGRRHQALGTTTENGDRLARNVAFHHRVNSVAQGVQK